MMQNTVFWLVTSYFSESARHYGLRLYSRSIRLRNVALSPKYKVLYALITFKTRGRNIGCRAVYHQTSSDMRIHDQSLGGLVLSIFPQLRMKNSSNKMNQKFNRIVVGTIWPTLRFTNTEKHFTPWTMLTAEVCWLRVKNIQLELFEALIQRKYDLFFSSKEVFIFLSSGLWRHVIW
jgi:hypothetical protein